MQGIGCGLLLPMIFAIPSQWFRRHRGVASGIVIAGASLGGAVSSLILQAMLGRLGFHKTLLIYSFVQGITMLVGFSLIKTRFPTSQLQNKNRKIVWVDKQYFKDLKFWSFWAALLFAVFGYMTPFVYISVYTREKIPQISDQLANLPIPIMAFASTIGRTTVGLTGDRIGFLNAFILVILISSFCQAVLWNVAAESYAGIMVFSIIPSNLSFETRYRNHHPALPCSFATEPAEAAKLILGRAGRGVACYTVLFVFTPWEFPIYTISLRRLRASPFPFTRPSASPKGSR
ncbi:hypothetical protein RSOLAG1IB_10910 [Rhizoctonia solani AG-1 IB]|uniref:Uncharacterized protein n=1 Tax=Thanatephorus cucumeris (strain AG1-IB / isolate 7/3/14) TaxID=1108050 RepID=A0A0B7G5B6_THACB|nr:hypothetical protein RSOLAG1IB_10910 [Rhizoctonia solani AG-1 IB]